MENPDILEITWWCHVEGAICDSYDQHDKEDHGVWYHAGSPCEGIDSDHVQVAVVVLPRQR